MSTTQKAKSSSPEVSENQPVQGSSPKTKQGTTQYADEIMDEVEERSDDFRDSSSEVHEKELSPAKRDSVLNRTMTSNGSVGQE
jgi:hypothetical protein